MFLLCTLPLFVFLAVFIKLDSKGPVFYRQVRIGRGGKPFMVYKFRTMVTGAEKIGPLITERNDRRTTKAGRFLRAFSLDEVPQFINVFLGDMSVVGPRPEVRPYVKKYSSWQRKVLAVKPGITGLSQVNGRADLSIPTKLRYDIYYIKHMSLWMDIKIILKTVIVVFRREGAY